ncbi:conserved hypothetical protein [Lactobacillus acetotolerans]|uniref:Uncharacterized protein n=1 Tax=Lactobacillus acetotolerans TaxID=1600 RepID=A0A0D6A1D2_9LACO|nr:transcriptional regulator [Lactobacillus acetotolerans]BAQ56546.1 conserved hypothetical protein [Lactobacillus acetotolerans]
MTSNEHNFEELMAPAATAKKLGISVATLRKYSLIVEKVTGNKKYYERTKQKARLYHEKDIKDLDAFHKLARNSGLTLQEAARQIYEVRDKNDPDQSKDAEDRVQDKAIDSLQKQLSKIEKQNKELLDKKQVAAPKADDNKFSSLPDILGIVSTSNVDAKPQAATKKEHKPMTREAKRAELAQDKKKSEAEVHSEIINKAKENAQKRANVNVHRTLAGMQVQNEKKHWWQKFLNF